MMEQTEKEMILFYPDKIRGYARVKLLCDKARIPYTQDLSKPYKVAFNYNEQEIRKPLELDCPVINGRCLDVTKSNVDRIFTEVFGYSSLVDPEESYKYVRKSEKQGDKSGKVFHEIQLRKEGFIYQKLIHNVINGYRIEYRTYIIDGKIVWIREKWKKSIFDPALVKSRPALHIFSTQDRKKIEKFCNFVGMDYGELDILIDVSTSKLYIIDVNDIPGIRRDETRQAKYNLELKTLTRKFYDNYFKEQNKSIKNR